MNRFNVAVVDCETTVYNEKITNFKANPHHPDNQMVSAGILNHSSGVYIDSYHDPRIKCNSDVREIITSMLNTYDMLVGHNIKFDLLYFMKECPEAFFDFVARGGSVWDTMVVDYILSGQTNCFTPLSSEYRIDGCGKKTLVREGLAVRYGGTDKPDKIKEYWDAGIMTEDIDHNELLEYQSGDVHNTALIFKEQSEEVVSNNMTAVVMTTMDALLALTEIEFNGSHFDWHWAEATAAKLKKDIDAYRYEIEKELITSFPDNIDFDINPDSDSQIAKVVFGGKIKLRGAQPMLDKTGMPMYYKSGIHKGNPRTKKLITIHHHKGWINDIEKRNKKGDHPIGDEVIQTLIDNAPKYRLADWQVNMLENVKKLRSLRKEVSTYYVGYSENTWPHDGCIHPNYNQVITPTARLSCTNPNLQNVKRDEE